MRKFEVIAPVWSSEEKRQARVVVGSFDKLMNARLFADVYSKHYSVVTEIADVFECGPREQQNKLPR